MGTYKNNRTAEDIKREITTVISELKDPRISEHLISVARTETASDLSYVKVYISAIEGIDTAKSAVKALTGATGLIRREVGKHLGLRKTPEMRFVADDSIAYGMEIAKKLDELLSEKKEEEVEDED